MFEYDQGACRTLSADEYEVLFLPQKWHLETGELKPMSAYLFDSLEALRLLILRPGSVRFRK